MELEYLFFPGSTANGAAWRNRDTGLMISGDYEQFSWYVTAMNGTDGAGDELFLAGRVEFDVFGEGIGEVEGAYGAPDSQVGTVGVAIFDDGNSDDGDGQAVDFHMAASQYSFGAEFVAIGDSAVTDGVAGYGLIGGLSDDSSPFSVQGTYMFEGEWEVGARFQDLDNDDDSQIIEIGVNRYLDGHDLKYGLHFSTLDSDSGDADLITLLLQLGF